VRTARKLRTGVDALYHGISRIVGGQFLLGDTEKEQFRIRLYKLARFLQIEVRSFTILSNHYHLILKVPGQVTLTDPQLLRALQRFYGPKHPQTADFARALADPDSPRLSLLRQQYLARMGDLSNYMKELKQGYTKWFNKLHERYGTLWAERFYSKLVSDDPWTLLILCLYLDLNGFRAGLTGDPALYRWCSYSEALARDGPARRAYAQMLPGKNWEEKLARYRRLLYGAGAWGKNAQARTFDAEEVLQVWEQGGQLSLAQMLRLKVKWLTEGLVLGSKEFVQEMYEELWAPHQKRPRVACWPLEGADWGGLVCLKKIKNPVQLPKKTPAA